MVMKQRGGTKQNQKGNAERFSIYIFSIIGCSVAQLVARWLAVRQARVRISARHPKEVPPTEPTAMKIWRWASANVYE